MKRAFLFCFLLSSVALAAPPKTGDEVIEEAAKTRYTEGVRLYNKKRFEEARAAFLQANALKKRPAATIMLAQSSLRAGRWIDALKAYDQYIADVGNVPEKLKDIIETGRKEARSHIGRLKFVVPEGAEVVVDGDPINPQAALDVMPGSHIVVITHHEEKKTQTVESEPGETVEVKPAFIPKSIIPQETRARPKPVEPKVPPPPSDGGPTGAPQTETSLFTPPTTMWPLYVSGVVALGGLGAAAVFGGLQANASHAVDVSTRTLANDQKDRSVCTGSLPPTDKYYETCLTLQRNEQISAQHAGTFTTTLIVGLAGTAVAAGYFFFAPRDRERGEKPKAIVTPWVGPQGAGASMQGAF